MVTAFKGNGTYQGVMLPNGHYTPITLAKEISKYGYTLTTGLPHEMTLKHNLPNHFSVTLGRLDAIEIFARSSRQDYYQHGHSCELESSQRL